MKIFLVVLLVVGLVFVGIFLATSRTEGQQNQSDEEPTLVQKGQFTQQEREFSKEYKKLYPDGEREKLSSVSARGNKRGWNKEIGVSLGEPTIPEIGDSSAISSLDFLRNRSCKADAIVRGFAKKGRSHLIDNETFAYTDYEFHVTDVLKDNSASPIQPDQDIEVTRPGGLVKLDGQIIRAEDRLYPPLQGKSEYVLFLHFVPLANGYVMSEPRSEFSIDSGFFKPASNRGLPAALRNTDDASVLIDEIRKAVAVGCYQNVKGDEK